MRLTELEPEFLKWLGPEHPESCQIIEGPEQADGLWFLCPLCFLVNGGPVGTHGIKCWKPHVPQTVSPTPGRWNQTGTGFHDLSLVASSSSIQLTDGCRWHGYVQNGEVHGDLDAARVDAERARQAEWRANRERNRVKPPRETNMADETTGDFTETQASDAPAVPPVPVDPSVPPPGYAPTTGLRFVDGELQQRFTGPHDGDPALWLPVPSIATKPAPTPEG